MLGRTLRTGGPVWIRDLRAGDGLPGTQVPDECGLAAAFALPILVRADTVGVLEFFGRDVQEPDDLLLLLGSSIGAQLGRVIERETAEKQLTHQALYDGLTGLPNRALLRDRLHHSLQRAHRRGTRVDVLYLDVDDFKVINDSRGHAAGDEVLAALSSRLLGAVREGDTVGRLAPSPVDTPLVARLEGDEFVILLEDCVAPDAVAERLGALLKKPLHLSDSEVFVSLSVGSAAARIEDPALSADDLLAAANLAMHEAKRAGKGQHVPFQPSMHERARHRHRLGEELHRAVENQEFEVHYQPIVALVDGTILGAEALVRWRHPVRGLLLPEEFFARAEETGLIVALGGWVLQEACGQAAGWRETYGADLSIAVNVSGRQLREAGFVASVRGVLASTGLAPRQLCLELTESVLMEHQDDAIGMLTALREDGIHLAVDDFGTGYSSLGALRRLPADLLKIDRSFVTGLPDDEEDSSIAWTIVRLAQRLGMTVLAEGVATVAQREALCALGCDQAQGYLFSPPLPAATFASELAAGRHSGGRMRMPPQRSAGSPDSGPVRPSATRTPRRQQVAGVRPQTVQLTERQ